MPVQPLHYSFRHSSTGTALAITIEKVGADQYFRPSSGVFVNSGDVSFSQKRIPLVEGSAENLYGYTVAVSNVSGINGLSDPGLVRIRVHDEGNSNRTIWMEEGYVVGGALIRPDQFVSTRATAADVASALNTAFTDGTLGISLAELAEVPPKNPTIGQVLMLLYMHTRNRADADSDGTVLCNDAGTPIIEAPVTETENNTTRGKMQNVVTG
jgi:hypothetical protein